MCRMLPRASGARLHEQVLLLLEPEATICGQCYWYGTRLYMYIPDHDWPSRMHYARRQPQDGPSCKLRMLGWFRIGALWDLPASMRA